MKKSNKLITTENAEYDLMNTMLSHLRSEISQSVSKQHKIAIGGYSINALIAGYIINTDCVNEEMLLILPFLFIAMSSLWIVESNRMVRASFFIGNHIWPKLKELLDLDDNLNWEIWCRQKVVKEQRRFLNYQNYFQIAVIVIIPAILSTISIVIWAKQNLPILLLGLIILSHTVIWLILAFSATKVTNLSKS